MSQNVRKNDTKKINQTKRSSRKPKNIKEADIKTVYDEEFPELPSSNNIQLGNAKKNETRNERPSSSQNSEQETDEAASNNKRRDQQINSKQNCWSTQNTSSTSETTTPQFFTPDIRKWKQENRVSDNPRDYLFNENKSRLIEEINVKLAEIILSIHLKNEYPSVERVEQALFRDRNIRSFKELGIHQKDLSVLTNHIHRDKDVILYMQVFEQVYNLCTLNDLVPLITKFLKLNRYEDAHLGPLDKHPNVRQVFGYIPKVQHQPIPEITSGAIICTFMEFLNANKNSRSLNYENFSYYLANMYGFERPVELGFFCKSFPYLTQVTRRLISEWNRYQKQIESNARQTIIETVGYQLQEIQQEISNQLEPTLYTDKTPVAVFDHLISIVDKHLNVPQQKAVRDLLAKLRNDELLRCLLNISIYLGSIPKPNKLIAEFHSLNQNQNKSSLVSSKTDRPERLSALQNVNVIESTPSNIHETSFIAPSTTTAMKPQIPLKQVCSDLYQILVKFDSVLTIKQIFDITDQLCRKHSVKNFFEFGFKNDDDDDDDDENNYLDIISFIYKHRDKIDPHGSLSVYDYTSSNSDRQDIFAFANELTPIKKCREIQEQNKQSASRPTIMNQNQTAAISRALQYKFPECTKGNRVSQVIRKVITQEKPNKHPIVHYEECLLDEIGLNRLGMCPPSILIDENQLCEIILQCPIMIDLLTWLQWPNYFQSKYGLLKTFISRKSEKLTRLLILETSNSELLRIPVDSTFQDFEKELHRGNIRLSVGHLCSLIVCEYITVSQLPRNIFQQTIKTWLTHLRSSNESDRITVEPMGYVLEFLMYLPILIGQSKIVQEILLETVDEVFDYDDKDDKNGRTKEDCNTRKRIWMLANNIQKKKLEFWGYVLHIDEWKNEKKWEGIEQPYEEESGFQFTTQHIRRPEIVISQPIVSDYVQSTNDPPTVFVSPPSPSSKINEIVPIVVNQENRNVAAYEHIKQIRHRLGVDSKFDPAGQYIVENLQGLIERSLQKLSKDLFSEEGHLVLELVQNADDNQYSPDSLPTLRFVISSDRILVCNNEIGFQPNNVEAICNVGKSTKGKHKQGYAGHKGIGFKSVFMISDCPEIHSGDYHFCFDTKNGTEQIGYIRPIWLDQFQENLPSSDEWRTCIRLPIEQKKRTNRLRRNFDDIHPKLLLFLNRLRRIEIICEKENKQEETKTVTRIDHAQGQIIELQEKSASEQMIKSFWLVVKTIVQIPINIKMQFSDIKCDAESTTIAIAYPLDKLHDTSSYETLPFQSVFAYLPLRPYGFRFIIQGDFEVPATREDIFRDNGWNEWLKQEMIRLLPVAYESFKMLPDILKSCSSDVQDHIGHVDLIESIKYFIKMIPTRNELDPYFNSFIDKSIQNLMGVIKLPVITDETSQSIEWISPTQCVFVRDTFIKQIFTHDLLYSHFNNYYISEQFVRECNESILTKLGCQKLDFSNILRLIRSLYTKTEQEYTTKTTSIEQIAQWFLCIDYSLQQEREKPGFNIDNDESESEETTIEQLKQMKIIPLKNELRLVSMEEFKNRTILFPLDKSMNYEKYLRIVLEDLPTIDEQLLDFIQSKYPHRLQSIKRLLKDLGISDSRNSRKIYSNHILPTISDMAQWSTKSDSVLIAYVIFIYKSLYFDKPDHFASEMDKLKNTLIIKIRQGKFIRINSNQRNIVHLTSFYGSKISLDSLKSFANQFIFISDDYFKEYHKDLFFQDKERRQFNNFLQELDIHDFFLTKRDKAGFANVDQLTGTQWNHVKEQLETLIFEPFIIHDIRCEEFDELISSKDNASFEKYASILLYLDSCFPIVSHYFATSVIRSRGQYTGNPTPVLGVETSFCLSLRKYAWIPVSDTLFLKPNDVYYLHLNNPFRRYVPCIDQSKIPLQNEGFINILGLKCEILPNTMFELFMKWSCNLEANSLWNLISANSSQTVNIIPCQLSKTEHQSCRDTLANIKNIYMYLLTNPQIITYLSQFQQWPLIFVPRTGDIGEFLFSHEVFWHDPESLLTVGHISAYDSTHRFPLKPYYDDVDRIQQLFINIFQVKAQPNLEDYLPLLNNLGEKNIEYIWKCIQVITRLTFQQDKQEFVKNECRHYAFIPCLSSTHKLVKYTVQPYYPHDKIIADLFSDQLPIVHLTDNLLRSKEFKHQFCTLFNINDLSDVIQIVINVTDEESSEVLYEFYSNSIDLIQSYLFEINVLSEDRSNYLRAVFSEMKFISVSSIDLLYQYEHIIRRPQLFSTLDGYVDESIRKFYILKRYEDSERHINTFVSYLIQEESQRLKLSNFIQVLFRIYQDKGLSDLAERRKALPVISLEKWFIPEGITSKIVSPENERELENTIENDETVTVPQHLIQGILNEVPFQLPKSREKLSTEQSQTSTITSFPHNRESNSSFQPNDSDLAQTNTKPSTSTQNLPNSLPTSHLTATNGSANQKNDAKEVKSRENETIDEKKCEKRVNQNNQTAQLVQSIPLTLPKSESSSINFENVCVSTFTKVPLSSAAVPQPPLTINMTFNQDETDAIGRRGEEFVYKYLQWKYPTASIKWINEINESGKPFDIQIDHTQTGKEVDFIEVKTTCSSTQNTFQISVNQLKCLMEYPNNYHIYRVYYNPNDELSSTITVLSEIKCNLDVKRFALSMTVPLNTN